MAALEVALPVSPKLLSPARDVVPPSPRSRADSPHDTSPSRAGRTAWVQETASPGPAAYNPNISSVVSSSERTVFGTAQRDQESKRFISSLHNASIPNDTAPGPGTYRTHTSPLHRSNVTTKFGSEAQRPGLSREDMCKPGPIYELPSCLSSRGTHFAHVMGGSDAGRLFLSPQNSKKDRTLSQVEQPSPLHYSLVAPDVVSQHETAPGYTFGKASRESKAGLTAEQLKADPTTTTCAETPAAYDLGSTLSTRMHAFGTASKLYTPDPDGDQPKAPFISRLHAASIPSLESPGPGAYEPVTSPQERPTGPRFGSPPAKSDRSPRMQVPGPGAHNPKVDALSRATTGAAYTMGPNLRTDFSAFAPASPGPAAYGLTPTSVTKSAAPAYSLGGGGGSKGRQSFVTTSETPGPNAYGVPGINLNGVGARDGPGSPRVRGYTFGMKEKTKAEGSTASLRYHGPLAAAEHLCTESPGPGAYDVRGLASSGGRNPSPMSKFGSSTRDQAAVGAPCVESPGPGTYIQHDASGVSSRYKNPKGGTRFSKSERFRYNASTF